MPITSVLDRPPVHDLDTMPLERLETEITSLTGRISAATCQLLLAIAVYDRREGWQRWECRSMSHWLTWRTALSPQAAREHVRVARALEDLPVVTREFSAGRLSYSQVRALTRVAVPATEAELVGLARSMTAGQLDRLAARYRGVRAATTETAQARRSRRGLVSYLDDDGTFVIIVRLAPEDGEAVRRAVEWDAEKARRARQRSPECPEAGVDPDLDEGVSARHADALVALVVRGASAGASSGAHADRAVVVVHVGAEVLAEDDPDGPCHVEHGASLAPETARRLSCDSATVVAVDGRDGTVEMGRRSRRVSPTLHRALALRDPTCVFPGCETVLGTEHHHVRHWMRGGPTTLSNMATLCGFHHHRLHEGGYSMRCGDGGRGWSFLRPDGRVIPAVWDPPRVDDLLPIGGQEIDPEACVPDWDGTALDLGWTIESLLQIEGLLPTGGADSPLQPVGADDPSADPGHA